MDNVAWNIHTHQINVLVELKCDQKYQLTHISTRILRSGPDFLTWQCYQMAINISLISMDALGHSCNHGQTHQLPVSTRKISSSAEVLVTHKGQHCFSETMQPSRDTEPLSDTNCQAKPNSTVSRFSINWKIRQLVIRTVTLTNTTERVENSFSTTHTHKHREISQRKRSHSADWQRCPAI